MTTIDHESHAGGWLDASGVTLSAACVVHCLALPLLAAALPFVGVWAEAEWVHWAFVILAAPITLLALREAPRRAMAAAGVGVLLLFLGAAEWPIAAWHRPLTLAGALLLATVHVWNALARPRSAIARAGAAVR